MSVAYDLNIVVNENFVLKINFFGIKEGETTIDTLSMSIYAYKCDTGEPIFTHSLWVDEIRRLYRHLSEISLIKDVDLKKSWRFIEANEGVVDLIKKLDSIKPDILRIIFDKFQEDDRIAHILSVLTEVEAKNLYAAYKYQIYQKAIENLKELLRLEKDWNIVSDITTRPELSEYIASQPEKIFQNWIEKNLWIFGVEYIEKYDFRQIAFHSEADLLMKSMDGFLDLIELKRPNCELLKYDRSHNCYYPATELSQAIGQSTFYLRKMDEYKLVIESENKNTQVISPRIKIIAGRTDDFNDEQFKTLRMLNSSFNNMQIISYDYLLQCWEYLLSHYAPTICLPPPSPPPPAHSSPAGVAPTEHSSAGTGGTSTPCG